VNQRCKLTSCRVLIRQGLPLVATEDATQAPNMVGWGGQPGSTFLTDQKVTVVVLRVRWRGGAGGAVGHLRLPPNALDAGRSGVPPRRVRVASWTNSGASSAGSGFLVERQSRNAIVQVSERPGQCLNRGDGERGGEHEQSPWVYCGYAQRR
jgi:hypothetical protein